MSSSWRYCRQIDYVPKHQQRQTSCAKLTRSIHWRLTTFLSRIEAFGSKDWAQSGDSHPDWLTVGAVYKSAVSLYASLSLGSLGVLPPTVALENSQAAHNNPLFCELHAALKVPRIAKFMVWPLVVAGVQAKERGEATRNWVEASLRDISRVLGTGCPIKACAVLKMYWASDASGWDECFDRPNVLI